jgi:hypothetical protein
MQPRRIERVVQKLQALRSNGVDEVEDLVDFLPTALQTRSAVGACRHRNPDWETRVPSPLPAHPLIEFIVGLRRRSGRVDNKIEVLLPILLISR